MARELLTITQIQKALPKQKEYLLNDGANLYLKVLPSGTKSFFFIAHKTEQGKKRLIKKGLGKFPKITLEQARKKAQKERERLANIGLDEINAKFGEYFLEYLKIKQQGLKGSSKRIIELCYSKYFIKLANLKLSSITRNDILKALEPLLIENKAQMLHTTLSYLSGFFEYSLQFNRVSDNPVNKISTKFLLPNRKKVRHNPHLKDIKSVLELKEKVLSADIYPTIKQAFMLILFTATRANETLGAIWSEFDLEKGLWIIPAERMKAKKEFVIPLSVQLLSFLKELYKNKVDDNNLIFKSITNKKIPTTALSNFLNTLGYKNVLTTHGLRGTFASIANDLRAEHGLSNDIIQASLSHETQNAVAKAYNHSIYLEERKRLLQWWADKLGEII